MQIKIERSLLEEVIFAIEELSEEVKTLRNWKNLPYQVLVIKIKETLYQNEER